MFSVTDLPRSLSSCSTSTRLSGTRSKAFVGLILLLGFIFSAFANEQLPFAEAAQSSTGFGGAAGRAIDGDTNGRYRNNSVTHTDNESQPWWSGTLQEDAFVTEVTLWNRTDNCCTGRLSDFYVFVSNQPFQNTDVDSSLADENVWSSFHQGSVDGSITVPVGANGRYIRVQLQGSGVVSLAEVVVVGTEPTQVVTNLALSNPAQSSTGFGGLPGRAIDGDNNGRYSNRSVTHTNNESQPWWSATLENDSFLTEVTLWNRSDNCCTSRLNDIYVLVSNQPFQSTDLASTLADTNVWSSFHAGTVEGSVTIPVNTVGRYIRIQLQGTGVLSLAEVVAIGIEAQAVTTLALQDADQSSTGFRGVPSRAIDGNVSGRYSNNSVTHTNNEAQPWWSATLESDSIVTEMTLWNRTDNCCTSRLNAVYVLVSSEPFQSTDLASTLADTNVWSSFHAGTVDGSITIPVNTVGRYIRIQLQGSGVLSLAEVAVTGFSFTSENRNPIAIDDFASVDRGGSVEIDILSNDTVDNDSSTVVNITSQPSNGTVTILLETSSSRILYSPFPNTPVNSDSFEYTITDVLGSSDSAVVTISLEGEVEPVDTTAPIISLLGLNPQLLTIGEPLNDPGATAVDDTDGDVAVSVESNTVTINAVGEYEIVYSATDAAGNTATLTRDVIVSLAPDTVPPAITILGDNPTSVLVGGAFSDLGATATDDIDGTLLATVLSNNVDLNNAGSYAIVYEAVDAAGNSASATRLVNVTAGTNTGPVITLVGPRIHEIGINSAYQEFGVSARDNNGDSVSVSITDNINYARSGSYAVTYSATDSSGNTTSAIRSIVVKELPLARSLSSPIPQTGAVVSFEPGDDGVRQAGSPRSYQHDLVADMVYDNTYDIVWQDSTDNTLEVTWDAANSSCSNLVLGGYSDWRLPSTFELAFLVDFGQIADRTGRTNAIDSEFVHWQTESSPWFWSSEPAVSPNYEIINFLSGRLLQDERDATTVNYYRCVRGATPDFTMRPVKVPEDVSYDTLNRLMWQDNATVVDAELNWPDALQYCEDLSLNNADDWRLPNSNELFVVLRYTTSNINNPFDRRWGFGTDWWTSSINPDDTQSGRQAVKMWASSGRGNISADASYNTRTNNVRCVRDFLSPTAVSQGDVTALLGDVQFDGSASIDLDGSITSYQWFRGGSFGSRTLVAEGAVVSTDAFDVGSHDIIFVVTDNHSVTATEEFTLTVRENQNPLTGIVGDTSISPLEPIEFTASFSFDPDGIIVSYLWELDGTVVGNEVDLFIAADAKPAPGAYTLTLTVTDNDGGITTRNQTIRLSDGSGNAVPIADAGPNMTTVEGVPVTFDGSNSLDPDGTISSYTWTRNNRFLSDEPVFNSDTFTVGTHLIQLEVRDNSFATDIDTMTLTVLEAGENSPPVAQNKSITTEEDVPVALNLVATDANPTDTLTFSIIDLPANGSVVIENDQFVYTPNPDFIGTDMLTFKANDGEFDSNVATVNITISEVNDPPQANAGANIFITEGDTVFLDGTSSSDDGIIISYEWQLNEQVVGTGSLISVPNLPVGQNFIELFVTDDANVVSSDTVLVNVAPRTPAGFVVSSVTGNTAEVGSTATFTIALTTPPSADVSIAVSSSNELEGVPTLSSVSFTPLDWDVPKTVVVVGSNPDVFRGMQNYQIILEPAVSADQNYSGLNPDDVDLDGINLVIEDLGVDTIFVSNVRQSYTPVFDFNGTGIISHRLSSGPAGISIDEPSGTLIWTPPLSAEGGSFTVAISSEIGNLTFDNSLTIQVTPSTVVKGSFNNNTFVVSDATSSFDEFEFKLLESAPDYTVREVPSTSLPALPGGAEPITQGFYAESDIPLEVYIPIERLVDPYSISRLEYYTWYAAEALWSMSSLNVDVIQRDQRWYATLELVSATGAPGIIAIRPALNPDIFQIDTSHSAGASSSGLLQQGSVISPDSLRQKTLYNSDLSRQQLLVNPGLLNPTISDVDCQPRGWKFLSLDYRDFTIQICTVRGAVSDGEPIRFSVTGFGTSPTGAFLGNDSQPILHWLSPPTSIQTMMTWVGETRNVFDQLGIATRDKSIRINVANPEDTFSFYFQYSTLENADRLAKTVGYVLPFARSQRAEVLNLSSGVFPPGLLAGLGLPQDYPLGFTQERMQVTTVHEYFHHAQAKTDLGGGGTPFFDFDNPEASRLARWIAESSATWFSDFVYDDINGYVDTVLNPLGPVLFEGIHSKSNNDDNPYGLMPFFKMLSQHCATFETELKNLLYRSFAPNDIYRIEALKDVLSNANCDFGQQAGESEKDKLSAGFLLYQYATLYAGQTGLTSKLEADEDDGAPLGLIYEEGKASLTNKLPLSNSDLTRKLKEGNSPDSGLFEKLLKFDLPPYSAKSIEIANLFDDRSALQTQLDKEEDDIFFLETGDRKGRAARLLEAFVKINSPNGGIKLGVLNDENPNFIGNTSLDGEQHVYLESNEACAGEFVYPASVPYGKGFITFINDTDKTISDVGIQMGLRDHIYFKDPAKQISTRRDRSLEWEDVPASATRKMSWDEADAFCANYDLNGHDDWELPELTNFASTWYQNRSGTGAVANLTPNGSYWTQSARRDSTGAIRGYETARGDGDGGGDVTTTIAGVPLNSLRHVRCVRYSTNICEIQ